MIKSQQVSESLGFSVCMLISFYSSLHLTRTFTTTTTQIPNKHTYKDIILLALPFIFITCPRPDQTQSLSAYTMAPPFKQTM